MRRGWVLAFWVLLAGCIPVASGTDAPIQPRILSLNPCTDALLAELADRDQILALSASSRDPRQSSMDVALARSLPASDGTLEEVIAARPALVVSGSFTPPATRAAYARLGLRLEEFGMADTVEASEAQVRRMAALVGHRERGEALVARIEAGLRAARFDGARVSALVWQGGGLVAGPHTLVVDVLGRTGFAPLAATKGLSQSQFLPLEAVVADPPRVILAVSHGESGEGSRGLGHPVLAGLAGVRRFRLDPALEYCGGPTIIRLSQRLSDIRRAVAGGA